MERKDSSIGYNDTLDLIIECSSAEYCTSDTTLEELGIDPIEVIKSLLFSGDIELEIKGYDVFELTSDDNHTVMFTQPIVEFETPISEISTIGCLANELTQICMDENYYHQAFNGFNLIESAECDDTENGWFTEETSWEYSGIDASEFIKSIKEQYGVQIEKKAITGFNGSVRELCESLTDRINRALEFQKGKE